MRSSRLRNLVQRATSRCQSGAGMESISHVRWCHAQYDLGLARRHVSVRYRSDSRRRCRSSSDLERYVAIAQPTRRKTAVPLAVALAPGTDRVGQPAKHSYVRLAYSLDRRRLDLTRRSPLANPVQREEKLVGTNSPGFLKMLNDFSPIVPQRMDVRNHFQDLLRDLEAFFIFLPCLSLRKK